MRWMMMMIITFVKKYVLHAFHHGRKIIRGNLILYGGMVDYGLYT